MRSLDLLSSSENAACQLPIEEDVLTECMSYFTELTERVGEVSTNSLSTASYIASWRSSPLNYDSDMSSSGGSNDIIGMLCSSTDSNQPSERP